MSRPTDQGPRAAGAITTRHPGYVSTVLDGETTLVTLDEYLAGPKPVPGAFSRYYPTLEAMEAWSDRVGYRIAPKPVPDEAQVARIAQMLTRND